MPRPSQVGHVSEKDSTRPPETRLRVTCINPRGPISNTCDRVLSTARASFMAVSNCVLFFSRSISMKSITIMPPMSRRRSCRATSRAASRFVLVTVASRLVLPTGLQVVFAHGRSEVGLAAALPGVPVDDRHRLCAFDDQVAARRQQDLLVQRL